MPRKRSKSSKSVAQKLPFPGLSMIGSPAIGASSGMMSQPGSPRTRTRPHGPLSPIPTLDAVLRDAQRPAKLKAEADSGDHIHPNDAGNQTMADAFDLGVFKQ